MRTQAHIRTFARDSPHSTSNLRRLTIAPRPRSRTAYRTAAAGPRLPRPPERRVRQAAQLSRRRCAQGGLQGAAISASGAYHTRPRYGPRPVH
eukprot:scaffold915_cov327-Prasinococcus_capsulatus_cf.AAC.4